MPSVVGFFMCLLLAQVTGGVAPEAPDAVPDYELGGEDILKVTVYGHKDLDQIVIVQPGGTFMFPLIGDVKASDLTVKELERKLTRLLAAYVRNPQVTVTVQEHRSKVVRVVGAVSRPGTFPIKRGATLVEILSSAGPLTGEAGATAVIVRPKEKVAEPPVVDEEGVLKGAAAASPNIVIEVDLREIDAGILERNVVLHPNDTVIVPKAPRVFVSGEVERPGAYACPPGLTVRQLISLAGGLTKRGSSSRLRIVRMVEGKAQESKIKFDSQVRPGDTLVVKAKLF